MPKLKRRIRSVNESVNGRMLTAAITVATMTAAVKAASMFKDIVELHQTTRPDKAQRTLSSLTICGLLAFAVVSGEG